MIDTYAQSVINEKITVVRTGLPKRELIAPLGEILVSWGAIISLGGAGKFFFALNELIQDILELQMKSKKKGLWGPLFF